MAGEQVPSIGRVVHFVLEAGPSKGQHRPAIIVRTWEQPDQPPPTYVNLIVFLDSANDGGYNCGDTRAVTSAQYDPTGTEPRTWHWPEFVAPKA